MHRQTQMHTHNYEITEGRQTGIEMIQIESNTHTHTNKHTHTHTYTHTPTHKHIHKHNHTHTHTHTNKQVIIVAKHKKCTTNFARINSDTVHVAELYTRTCMLPTHI